MGLLTHILTQDAKIIHTNPNSHGDQIVASETPIKSRFRNITELDVAANREGVTTGSDAIIWVEPEVAVEEGTIIFADSQYWRVNRIVRARRIRGDSIFFLKLLVNKHEL